MISTLINNYPTAPSNDGYVPCINCDWKFNYYDEVKEASINLMNKWNAIVGISDCETDWKIYIEEAIDELRDKSYVKCSCDNCY
jgi:hypothetical protein